MAWWDHEELKSKSDRSDRYKVSFPEEYSSEEVKEAQKRILKERYEQSLRNLTTGNE